MISTVILIPVLRRPHRVDPLLRSLEKATPEPHRVLFICSAGDQAEIHEVQASIADWLIIPPNEMGDYAKKINAGVASTQEPLLFLGADDLDFHLGWLSSAMRLLADPAVGVVGTQDLCNSRVLAGEHSTHSLMRRSYIEQHGTIDESGKALHEGYWHEFVDDEQVATAKYRDAWAFASESVVEHLHPMVGKAEFDDLYRLQRHRMVQGRRLFHERQHLWSHPSPS